MANIENNYDFTKEKINVMYKGEFQTLTFEEIEKMLDASTSLRSLVPFVVWAKGRIITQGRSISLFAQNFKTFLDQKLYFNNYAVFKMNIECGSVNLFKIN